MYNNKHCSVYYYTSMTSIKQIENPSVFRENIKCKLEKILERGRICGKSEDLKKIAANLEIGVYNYAIKEASQKKIIKKWENPCFVVLYLDRIRTIFRNLTTTSEQESVEAASPSPAPTQLIQKILSGEITPQYAATMTHQEMNEELWADLIDRKKVMDANRFTETVAASTTLFTCSKCKSNRCTFYSLQIRSCDEGETIFITCMDCGKRWKKNS